MERRSTPTLRPGAGADGRLLHRRRHASPPVRQARRASHRASRASPACISRSGRPMRSASRWSAISTTGTAAAMSMRHRLDTGVWEIFIPDLGAGHGLQIRDRRAGRQAAAAEGRSLRLRSRSCGPRPPRSSPTRAAFAWSDAAYLDARREARSAPHADVDLRSPSRLLAARTPTAVS